VIQFLSIRHSGLDSGGKTQRQKETIVNCPIVTRERVGRLVVLKYSDLPVFGDEKGQLMSADGGQTLITTAIAAALCSIRARL
jgi:hypothetical protein